MGWGRTGLGSRILGGGRLREKAGGYRGKLCLCKQQYQNNSCVVVF